MNIPQFAARTAALKPDKFELDTQLEKISLELEQKATLVRGLSIHDGWKCIKEYFDTQEIILMKKLLANDGEPEEDARIKDTIRARQVLIRFIESFKE